MGIKLHQSTLSYLPDDDAVVEFVGGLLSDDEYVEYQRPQIETASGKRDGVLVAYIRIISAAPEDHRSELHGVAWGI